MRKSIDALLEVKDLHISFETAKGLLHAVNGVSYYVKKGETLGIVGESGSGKSVSAYSILGLLKPPAKIDGGDVLFEGKSVLSMGDKELLALRGREASMIFQNPIACLDPVCTIGSQLTETVLAHDGAVSKAAARSRSIQMLSSVGIHSPELVLRQYPFELSGGMCQRVMIAIALLSGPKLLIADEPATALDVTVQSQLTRLLLRLQKQNGMAMIYITHDFGILAELCDRVLVMYGGRVMEQGNAGAVYYRPAHPYTRALLRALPRVDTQVKEPLTAIEGAAADPLDLPSGCVFHPRCAQCRDICREAIPTQVDVGPGHTTACWQAIP